MKKNVQEKTNPFQGAHLRGPGLGRMIQELLGRRRRLLEVAQVEVTSRCGGGCAYCPHSTMRGTWKDRNMSAETFFSLWPLFLETNRVHLQGWGEPLLHPHFLDMVRLARKAECLVSTTTCGLVMNKALAEALVKSGLDVIAFSLTGTSEESNDKARKGVDFSRVMEAIRTLQNARQEKMAVHLELHFAYLMLASQVEEVRALPELMRELGMHAAVVSTLDYLPSPEWAEEAFAPGEREKIAHARAVLEETSARAEDMGMGIYYSLPAPEALQTCLEHPERSVYVDAEGNLSPCIYVNLPVEGEKSPYVFGSSLVDDPLTVWKGHGFEDFRTALASRIPEPPCSACPKRFARGNRQGCSCSLN